MKRTLRLVGMAAMVLLLAASCKKDEKNASENEEGLVMMTFGAGIAQNNNAKTGLIPDGTIGTDSYQFKQIWLDSDKINVNGTPYDFSKYVGDSRQVAEFSGLGKPASDYYAIYPAENSNATLHYDEKNLDATTADFTIPSEQQVVKTVDEKSGKVMYKPTFAPMVAHCAADANDLEFTNLCGLLELRVYCPENLNLTVNSILITANNAEHIAGEWVYDFNGGTFSEKSGSASSVSVSMKFDNDIQVSHSKDNPTSFLFVVPPVTAEKNFVVYVTGNSVEGTYVTVGYIVVDNEGVMHNSPVQIEGGDLAYNTNAIELRPSAQVSINQVLFYDANLYPQFEKGKVQCIGTVLHENAPYGLVFKEKGVCIVEKPSGEEAVFPTSYVEGDSRLHKDEITNNGYDITLSLGDGLEANKDYMAAGYVVYKYAGTDNESSDWIFVRSNEPKPFSLKEPDQPSGK